MDLQSSSLSILQSLIICSSVERVLNILLSTLFKDSISGLYSLSLKITFGRKTPFLSVNTKYVNLSVLFLLITWMPAGLSFIS